MRRTTRPALPVQSARTTTVAPPPPTDDDVICISSDEEDDPLTSTRNNVADERLISLDDSDGEILPFPEEPKPSTLRSVSPSLLAESPRTSDVSVYYDALDKTELLTRNSVSVSGPSRSIDSTKPSSTPPQQSIASEEIDAVEEREEMETVISSPAITSTASLQQPKKDEATSSKVSDTIIETEPSAASEVVEAKAEDLGAKVKDESTSATSALNSNDNLNSTSTSPAPAKAVGGLEQLIHAVKRSCTKSETATITKTLWRKYGKLDFGEYPQLDDIVCEAATVCANNTLLFRKKVWKNLRYFYDFMGTCRDDPLAIINGPGAAAALPKVETPAPAIAEDAEAAKAKKQKQIRKLEKYLEQYEKLIEEWDQKDEDWDDDRNSPYLVKTRLVNRYMKTYNTLCKLTGCNTLTGRPTQKKIILEGVTKYPELNAAAEKLLNSKDALFVPDYHDMMGLTKRVNLESNLLLSTEEVRQTAMELFEVVVKILKKRRANDFKIAIKLDEEEIEDPADNDSDLERKLQANKAAKKSEDEILGIYTRKQVELNVVAEEVVDENPDDSAQESDEDEDEDSENDKAEGLVDEEVDETEEQPGCSGAANGNVSAKKSSDSVELADTSEESESGEEADSESSAHHSDSNGSSETSAKKPRLENVD